MFFFSCCVFTTIYINGADQLKKKKKKETYLYILSFKSMWKIFVCKQYNESKDIQSIVI